MNRPIGGVPGLPPVRRMRDWRLYTEDGSRFLDLRLLDNRGFLGTKGRFAGTRAKNGIDLGLLKEAPSVHLARFRKALLACFPCFEALRFFRNEERAFEALNRAWKTRLTREDFRDPLRRMPDAPSRGPSGAGPGDAPDDGSAAKGTVHRFFLDEGFEAELRNHPVRLVPLPCPAPFGPAVLGFASEATAAQVPEDELPPVMPFTALRAWEDFRGMTVRLTGGRRARSGEGAPAYTESLWKRVDRRLSPFFDRSGPYLHPRCPREAWEDFRARALAGGCVLTPEWELPSIVPGQFDDGELKKLADSLAGASTA